MTQRADVRSVDGLKELRSAVLVFLESVRNALAAADTDAYRRMRWVEEEVPARWREELKKRQAQFAEARVVLYRKQLGPAKDQQPHTEARFAFERAKKRVDEAEEKLREAQRWAQRLDRALVKLRGGTAPLGSFTDVQMQRAVSRLDALVEAVEAYLGTLVQEALPDTATREDDQWTARRGPGAQPGGTDKADQP